MTEPKLGLSGKTYLPLFVDGHDHDAAAPVGPQDDGPIARGAARRSPDPLIYRGVHRLNRDAQGRVKCVACFLCATACPAHCIDIVAAESPWPDREKYPQSFTIDELRCIFCGMCEEACPVDAIELTSLYDLSGKSREEMIFDKEKLLSVYDQTKDAEPSRSARMARAVGFGGPAMSQQQLLFVAAIILGRPGDVVDAPTRQGGGTHGWHGPGRSRPGSLLFPGPAAGRPCGRFGLSNPRGDHRRGGGGHRDHADPGLRRNLVRIDALGDGRIVPLPGAQFLAVATVVVYAGAILVTFLFVLMLAQPRGRTPYDRVSWEAMLSACTGAVIVGLLTLTVIERAFPPGPVTETSRRILPADRQANVLAEDHVAHLGAQLFGPHLIAVETGGTLLLAALIGAAVIVSQERVGRPRPRALKNRPKSDISNLKS